MRIYFLTTLITFLSFAQHSPASEVILSCKSLHNIFDPSYEQGSEVFLEVFYNFETRKAFVELDPPESPKVSLLAESENIKANFDFNISFIYIEWVLNNQSSYISIAYHGNFNWGAILMIGSEVETKAPSLKGLTEIKLACTEANSFKKLL